MRAIPLFFATWLIACPGPDTGNQDTGPEGDADADADADTDTDTDTDTSACSTPTVTFEPTDGTTQDLTKMFQTGDYVTLALPGELKVCPGTWYSRVLVRADTTVTGLGAAPEDTIMSGGLAGTILDVAGPNVTLNVSNVTLDRGAGLDPDHNSGGGGVYCEQEGVVNIDNAVFSANEANDGPGIYIQDCVLNVTNTNFHDNVSEDDGGAVTIWNSTATFDQVEIRDNESLDGGGMAVFSSEFTASNLTIADNRASGFAGGIWLYDSSMSLTDSVISGNDNEDGMYGGGIIVYGSATLERVEFQDNTATRGAGVFVYYKSTVEGTDCGFSGNSPDDLFASDGTAEGGIAYEAGGSGTSFSCANNACEVD